MADSEEGTVCDELRCICPPLTDLADPHCPPTVLRPSFFSGRSHAPLIPSRTITSIKGPANDSSDGLAISPIAHLPPASIFEPSDSRPPTRNTAATAARYAHLIQDPRSRGRTDPSCYRCPAARSRCSPST